MKYRENHYPIRLDAIVDAIRESGRQCLPHIAEYHRIALRMVRDGIEDLLHLGNEVTAQTRLLPIVPRRRFIELGLSDRAEDQR